MGKTHIGVETGKLSFKLLNNTIESKIHTEKMAKENLDLILHATMRHYTIFRGKKNDKNSIQERLFSNHFHLFFAVLHKTFTFKELLLSLL